MKTALSVAGTDPSGGAGLHADLKTFAAHGVYGMGAVTAVVAQNTVGVRSVTGVPRRMVRDQLAAVFEDIEPDAVKVGMAGSAATVCEIARALERYRARNVVIDPVLFATSGHALRSAGSLRSLARTLAERLFPLAVLVTPNIPEAETLSGIRVADKTGMLAAAELIRSRYGCAVLLKGGHLTGSCDDLLLLGDAGAVWLTGARIATENTHGTGCTLSAAIAANLAQGRSLGEAAGLAKAYLTGALSAGLDLGRGHGPVDHGWESGRGAGRHSVTTGG